MSKFNSPLYSVNVKEAIELIHAAGLMEHHVGDSGAVQTLLARAIEDLSDLRKKLEAEEASGTWATSEVAQ